MVFRGDINIPVTQRLKVTTRLYEMQWCQWIEHEQRTS